MTEQDYQIYTTVWSEWAKGTNYSKVATLSFNNQQKMLIRQIFPTCNMTHHTVSTWNLDYDYHDHYDLVLACNVFHYAKHPYLWFTNVMNSCDVFWIQDLVNRQRGSNDGEQFGDDNDCMRYSYENYKSNASVSFDLSSAVNVLDFKYYDSPNENGDANHFIAKVIKK
tara:strand:- start:1073 stop:1576 length:504 start_codon:yes stop_codon:yes gene_type:complete